MSYVILLILSVLLIYILYHCSFNKKEGMVVEQAISIGSSSPSAHSPLKNCTVSSTDEKGTLFLYPEATGFDVPDFNGFPDPEVVKNNFHTIAVVANHSTKSFPKQWTHPKVQELAAATGLPVTKWLSYYFGSDSNWACMCNWKGCAAGSMNGQARNCSNLPGGCTQTVFNQVATDVQNYKISGILFDDEVGDPSCIVKAMEYAKQNIRTHNGPLQLGWTKSLGSAKASSPDNTGSLEWDVCLGQAYTDNTNSLYNGSCNFSPTFWTEVAAKYDSTVPASRGVPMVCGAGNCIGDEDKTDKKFCTDERMSKENISKMLCNRPAAAQFKWRNFAIWYGTYPTDSNTGFFGCKNSNAACKIGCCKNWTR